MKVMWITAMPLKNVIKTDNLRSSGGWISAMLTELVKFEEITAIKVLSINKSIEQPSEDGKISYSKLSAKKGVFEYNSSLVKCVTNEILEFGPDIIDIQGSEFYLGNLVFGANPTCPVVVTLQGLVSEIWKKFFNEISVRDVVKKNFIVNSWLRTSLIQKQKNYYKRGENERYLLRRGTYFIGRTEWDKKHSLSINNNAKYYHCDRILRRVFYEDQWDISKINRFQIFTTQAHYPIKGLHILLESLHELIGEFPQIQLIIAGKSPIRKGFVDRLKASQYDNYILKLIEQFQLSNHIQFTGWLNSSELVGWLKTTHVFVCPSIIENSPNSLAEAQVLGVPCVASKVGGIESYIQNNETGLLYEKNESLELASKIKEIFHSDELAGFLSERGRMTGLVRHDPDVNGKTLLGIYKHIVNG